MIFLKRIKIETRAQHIWIRGVLMWGSAGILFFLIQYFLFGKVFGEAPSLSSFIINFIVFSIAGYFSGIWNWKIAQKKEKKHALGTNKY